MNRKGFFFIIVAFVLLSYILTSTYFWVRAIEMEESRYSEAFRTSSMEMVLSQVNEESVGEYVDISARYAFYRLNHHSIENPVHVPDDVGIANEGSLDGAELENIRLAMRELVLSGTASEDYFDGEGLEYTEGEKLVYSLDGWKNQLNASLAAAGFELVEFSIDEDSFEFNQVNFTQFELVFEMNMTIVDSQADSSTSLHRTYDVNRTVDATGMVDPYIARESKNLQIEWEGEEVLVGKPVFIAPYWEDGYEALCSGGENDPCYYEDEGSEGQGWFYGPVVMAGETSTVPDNATDNYILAGNYSAIKDTPDWDMFGAYILTSPPNEESSDCPSEMDQDNTFSPVYYDGDCDAELDTGSNDYVQKPFMVYEGFDIDDYGGADLQTGDEDAHKLLFVAGANPWEVETEPELKFEDVSVYNIENLRDFVMCGYYMPRNNSPSFLHRMFDLQGMFNDELPAYNDWPESPWGIETTAAGRWAGGNLVADSWDAYSRVDVEFFSEVEDTPQNPVQMIKGMPGNKNIYMCNMEFGYDPDLEHVGHFRLSDWAQEDREEYDDIYWIETDDSPDVPDNDNIGCDNDEQANCELD